ACRHAPSSSRCVHATPASDCCVCGSLCSVDSFVVSTCLSFLSTQYLFFFCSCSCRVVFYFFFSSRRRHTRLVSDWSSDVCSSDLSSRRRGRGRRVCATISMVPLSSWASAREARDPYSAVSRWLRSMGPRLRGDDRSEERRVGKEGRTRRWQGH